MRRGTAGVPKGCCSNLNGISRDLTPSGLKRPAAPALKGRRSDEICQPYQPPGCAIPTAHQADPFLVRGLRPVPPLSEPDDPRRHA